MTREQAKTLLPIIRAWSEGKTIQWTDLGEPWADAGQNPIFDSPCTRWRLKPEPREFWIAFGKADGLVKYIHSGILPPTHAAADTEIVHVREVLE